MPRPTIPPTIRPTTSVASVLHRLRRWPVESQLGSRRNAMLASTVLAARRAERDDVEAYLGTAHPLGAPAAAATAHG